MLLKEKKEIIEWLDKYEVKNYTLRPDETYGYVVDVAGDVSLGFNKTLTAICVKFADVSGNFLCSYNKLISLKGAPECIGKDFYCNDNNLNSLEGAPHTVGGNFICNNNQLTSLQGAPDRVDQDFWCNSNQLISLEGIPESIGGIFYCRDNPNLGELQKIESFNEIKAYLLSKKLAIELAHYLDNQKNNHKIKL